MPSPSYCITVNILCIINQYLMQNEVPAHNVKHWPNITLIVMRLKDIYRVHECGFRVCHQHKDVSIQAKLVNPAVKF